MNRITLHADGQLMTEDQRAVRHPLACLGYQTELADDCTLRSYFLMLDRHTVLTQLGDFYTPLMDQYRACPAEGCLWQDFECLQLAKTVEMVGFPGKPSLDIYNVFHGVGPDKSEEIRSLNLVYLLDMPLKLGRLNHVVFGDKVDTFDFETRYTFFEFIDSIAWELSFHGTPAQCNI